MPLVTVTVGGQKMSQVVWVHRGDDPTDLTGGEPEEGEPGGRIEYRTPTRVGRGDKGVNRAPKEAIGTAWASAGGAR